MVKLSNNWRRLIPPLAGSVALISFLNYLAGLNWVGKYDRVAVGISIILLMFAVLKIGPGAGRREQSKNDDGPQSK